MKQPDRHRAWDTQDELLYLEQIGEVSTLTQSTPQRVLLENYREGFMKRARFDFIDRKAVLAAVNQKLRELEAV